MREDASSDGPSTAVDLLGPFGPSPSVQIWEQGLSAPADAIASEDSPTGAAAPDGPTAALSPGP